MTIQTQYDHWDESGASLPPYVFSKPVSLGIFHSPLERIFADPSIFWEQIPSDPVLHDLVGAYTTGSHFDWRLTILAVV